MCKIILKFNTPLTVADIQGHREQCEKGAGFIWYDRGRFNLSKSLTHQEAFRGYVNRYVNTDRKNYSPFSLFHSRFPSAGTVNYQNAQPFILEDQLAFCHNGTMDADDLFMYNLTMNHKVDGHESDSLLMFKILKRLPIESACAWLKKTWTQNFVLCSLRKKEVYISGSFQIESKDNKVLTARNDWGRTRNFVTTDFNGTIKTIEKLGHTEPDHPRPVVKTVKDTEPRKDKPAPWENPTWWNKV